VNPTVLALIICGAAAVAESALAGGGVCQRLAQLRMPAYSPPFALWLVIGLLFYAMCFIVLRHLLGGAASSGPQLVALRLLILVLVANALWNVLFFAGEIYARASLHSFPMPLLSPRWWQYFFGFTPSALPYSRATVCTSAWDHSRFDKGFSGAPPASSSMDCRSEQRESTTD
jgi:tryptophan-rich sensory protein